MSDTPDRAGGPAAESDGRRQPRGERSGHGRRRGGRRRGGQSRRSVQRPTDDQQSRPEAPPPSSLVAYLARAGVGSRRRCDEIVRAARVTVDDVVVDFPRHKLDPGAVVAVDGDVVECRPLRYVLLNKPRGVASTRSDRHAEKVVVDAVPEGRVLFPVGRLDMETTGIIILTNDGPLAHRLMHPSYGVPKTYVVRVRGRVGQRALAAMRAGLELEDGMTAPAEARLIKQSAKTALVELTVHQGRKRQVRRMFTALGLTVDELHRRRYGPLSDTDLAIGAWRELSEDEVEALRRAAEHVEICVGEEPEEHGVSLAAESADPGRQSTRTRGATPVRSEDPPVIPADRHASPVPDAAGAAAAVSIEDQIAPAESEPDVDGDEAALEGPPGTDGRHGDESTGTEGRPPGDD